MKKIFCFIILMFGLTSLCFATESKKIVVLLDWFANPNHAPLFIAKEKGFFKEQNLDVELIGPSDPADPPKLVAAHKADIAITYEPQLMEQVSQGLPLVRIGTLIDKPLSCLVVPKNGSIKTIADLKNKRVGYSMGDLDNAILKVMLEKNGLTLKDIAGINVHYDLTQALLANKIDAATGMMRNFELIQLELAGHPARAFFPEQNGVPSYSELVLVINTDQVNDPRFAKFLIALQKGVDYVQKNPEETWEIFAKSHPELNDELNKRAWMMTTPYFDKHPAQFDQQSWLRFANFMLQNKMIKKIEPINKYAVILSKD